MQHLEGTLQKLAEDNQPVWGALAWVAQPRPNSDSLLSCVLVAGTIQTGSVNLVNPVGKVFVPPIDHVELNAYGYSTNLSDLMRQTEELTESLERGLEKGLQEIFPGREIPQAGADIYIEVTLKEAPTKTD